MEQGARRRDRASRRPDRAARHGEDRLSDLRPRASAPGAAITGLVLAGGEGRRMGGVDKGLLPWHGVPLARHAAERLAPQVATVAISANRNLDRYAAFAGAVWRDAPVAGVDEAHAGPLLGLLTAMRRATTPFVAAVPCDAPHFPHDLVARLAAALDAEAAQLATAATVCGQVWRAEPVFCLVRRELADDLHAFLVGGERRIGAWCARHRAATVRFADAAAFANLNTPHELTAAEGDRPPAPRHG